MATTTLKGQPFDRQTMDSMLRRRMFYTPSFEIYGGVAGLARRQKRQCIQGAIFYWDFRSVYRNCMLI